MNQTMLTDALTLGSTYIHWSILAWLFVPLSLLMVSNGVVAILLSKILVFIVPAIIIWLVSHTGLPVNTTQMMWGVICLIGLTSIFSVKKIRATWTKIFVKEWLVAEILLLILVVGYGLVRGFAPDVETLEKYMDWGFIVRYLSSPSLPALDMWQAGEQINYYSFGHFLASIVYRSLNLNMATGYNILLTIWLGMTASMAMALGIKLNEESNKRRLVIGILSAVMILFMGNGHIWWYLIKHGSLTAYWYAEATRFIPFTIHEFPAYSFIVSDLHAHLLALPLVLATVLIYIDYKHEKTKSILIGILLGVMAMTNTWDLFILSIMIGVREMIVLWQTRDIKKQIVGLTIIGATALCVFLPWWMSFQKITYGVYQVVVRSEWWRLSVLWGTMGMLALLASIAAPKRRGMIVVLLITGAVCLTIPELIYFKDIYPDHPRANTMFKFTFTGFSLISIASAGGIGWLLGQTKIWQKVLGVVGLIVIGGQILFASNGYSNYYNNFKNYQGLNGESWITTKLPFQAEVIKYLRTSQVNGNIVEAVGDSYTNLNTTSVFSGRATIQGWRVHEWLWRGSFDSVASRELEVSKIYEGSSESETHELIKKYKIAYIVVSNQEREKYLINDNKLKSLGTVVLSQDSNYLVLVGKQ